MNCQSFAASLGYHCAPIEGGGIVVTTPFAMPNGTSIPVFIEPAAERGHRLWDAGELLYEVIVSGVKLPDRRRLRGINTTIQQLGAKFTDRGALELFAAPGDLPSGFARFIEAALEVARWNERSLNEAPDHDDLVEEVHQLLIARRPNLTLERGVSIEGFTRRPLTFDFRQDGRLIDCISGTPNASAFEIRKLLDFRSLSAYSDTQVLVVVDDRHDPKRAAQEMEIISRLAAAQGVSALRTAAGAANTVH